MSFATVTSGHSGLVASLLIVIHELRMLDNSTLGEREVAKWTRSWLSSCRLYCSSARVPGAAPCKFSSLFFCLLLVVQGIRAEVECHTNGGDSTLSPKVGIDGLRTCRSSQGCYEAWGLVQEDYHLLYSSGCSTCPQFMIKMKCVTCNQTGCNKAKAQRIIASNLICYAGGSETSFGDKTVYCADTVDSCYLLPYLDQRTKKTNWEAGCGISNLGPTVPTPCGSECTVCKAALCNVPDELRALPKFAGSGSGQSAQQATTSKGDKSASSISSNFAGKPLPTSASDSRRSNSVSNASSTSHRDGAGNRHERVGDKPERVARIAVVSDEDFGAFPLSTETAASRPELAGSVSVPLAVAALPVVLVARAAVF